MWRKEKLEIEQHCLRIKNQRRLSRIRAAAGLKGRRAVVLRRIRQAIEDLQRGHLTVKPAKNLNPLNLAESLIQHIVIRREQAGSPLEVEILNRAAELAFIALTRIGDRTPAMVHTMKDVEKLVKFLIRFKKDAIKLSRVAG